MVRFTPLSGSWLNLAASLQRLLKRRALDGQHPETPEQSIMLLEATARTWNADPTPFPWGGTRAARRVRARQRRPARGGAGAKAARAFRWRAHGYPQRT